MQSFDYFSKIIIIMDLSFLVVSKLLACCSYRVMIGTGDEENISDKERKNQIESYCAC